MFPQATPNQYLKCVLLVFSSVNIRSAEVSNPALHWSPAQLLTAVWDERKGWGAWAAVIPAQVELQVRCLASPARQCRTAVAQLEPWLQSTQVLHFDVLMALLILVVTVLICEIGRSVFECFTD